MAGKNGCRWMWWCLIAFCMGALNGACAVPVAFDMGTDDSPLEDGFRRVTADQAYDADVGFGWVDGPYSAFDTSPPEKNIPFVGPPAIVVYEEGVTSLNRDGVWSDGDLSFRVDLPNGKYRVSLTIGHLRKILGSVDVYANRQPVAKNVDIRHFFWRSFQPHGYGWYRPIRFTVEVKEGYLEVLLRGDETEYRRLLAIEQAKPKPLSYLKESVETKDLSKKPRDFVLVTDIGLPFVGNSILGFEIYPYQDAPLTLEDDQLVATGRRQTTSAVGRAVRLFNEGRYQKAAQALDQIDEANRRERGIISLCLAGRPELESERELVAKAESDLAGVVAQNPEDYAAKELLWMAGQLREGIERVHHRGDFGKSGYTEAIRGAMTLAAFQPGDPLYWKAQLYRARVYYIIQPHRWSWVSGAGQDILLEVEKKWPDNRYVTLYLDGEWEPNEKWQVNDYVTGTEGAPEWAVACRDAWKTNLDMARWWIENKQRPDGSLGGGWGDDVELIVDFANYAFVSEGACPDVLEGVRKLCEGNWRYSGIDDEAGFYWGVADVGHSAEPTADTIPLMIFLDYGNPVWYERCMKSGKLMRDLWMAINPKGHRHFRSDYPGGMGIRGGTVANDGWLNYRAAVPAEKALWYNDNPTVAALFNEWAEALLEDSMKSERGKPRGVMPAVVSFDDCTLGGVDSPTWYTPNKSGGVNPAWQGSVKRADRYPVKLLLGAYERTGNKRFLEPFRIHAELANAYRARPVANPEEGSLDWVRKVLFEAKAAELWEFIERTELGADPRGAQFMTRQEAKEVADFIRHAVRKWWPLNTTEALVTDRVGFGGITDIVRVYTGGGIFVRDPIVNYVELGTEFAAFVRRSDRTHLRVAVYGFYDQERAAGLRPWKLARGKYKVTRGPDQDGDGEFDRVEESSVIEFKHRGQVVPFALPPKQETIVALEPVGEAGFGAAELTPDAAIAPSEIEYWEHKNFLIARVHNIGAAPVRNLRVEAWEGEPGTGKPIGTSLIPYIEAPNDLVAQTVRVGFFGVRPAEGDEIWIVLDPDNEIAEITEANNRCSIIIVPREEEAGEEIVRAQAAQPKM